MESTLEMIQDLRKIVFTNFNGPDKILEDERKSYRYLKINLISEIFNK